MLSVKYKIIGIKVYLERKKSRMFVGLLRKLDNEFFFEYEKKYLKHPKAIPLGPEMPLTRKSYYSKNLFVPFADRIPSRENPAYVEYCSATGISVNESDPFILLSSIAHRGPSSFIFDPFYDDSFSSKDLLEFRKQLNLSVKEFAICFDFSPAAITRVERDQSTGREILKRTWILANYPNIALDLIKLRGGILHQNKYKKIQTILLEKLKK